MGEMKKLYCVMKLSKMVLTKDICGQEVDIKVSGCEGIIPVYSNKKDAVKASCKGKYEILIIRKVI